MLQLSLGSVTSENNQLQLIEIEMDFHLIAILGATTSSSWHLIFIKNI